LLHDSEKHGWQLSMENTRRAELKFYEEKKEVQDFYE
jgi:hypothetical protein